MERSAPLIVPAVTKHTATAIFVHGLGDSGHGLLSMVENWRRRERLNHVKFILPHAPDIRITCNGGVEMPGWFDIKTVGGTVESMQAHEDKEGIATSREYVQRLITDQIDMGVPPDRIVLGGFSQGGAMSMLSGLTFDKTLAGIVVLSGWMLLSADIKNLVRPENKQTPIFMGHGDNDPAVKQALTKMSFDTLKEMGYNVKMQTYDMGHSVYPEELDDVESFLHEVIPSIDEK